MSSPIIIGEENKDFETQAVQAEMQELQGQMMAEMINMVTQNVIGNLLNAYVGFVYLDEFDQHIIKPENPLGFIPEKQNEMDSGYDLKSTEDFTLKAGERYIANLKIGVLLPPHLDMFILPRSGHAAKKGITVTNSPGLVDQPYFGYPIKVILQNTGTEDWNVKRGDRIAQARFQLRGTNVLFKEFDKDLKELQDKISRKGGIGHTGQ